MPSSVLTRDAPTLKSAMRNLSGGVSVVTSGTGDRRTGATVTSALSFAMEPETMIVSINMGSTTWRAIEDFGAFCVNVLAADQQHVAEAFSGLGGVKGSDRYRSARWTALASGAGVLEGALANIDCDVEHVVQRHSHALIFGSVRAVRTFRGHPLVYVDGRYGTLEAASHG